MQVFLIGHRAFNPASDFRLVIRFDTIHLVVFQRPTIAMMAHPVRPGEHLERIKVVVRPCNSLYTFNKSHRSFIRFPELDNLIYGHNVSPYEILTAQAYTII